MTRSGLALLEDVEQSRQKNPLAWAQPANPKVLDFWQSLAKTRCLSGGNRAAKTESAAIDFLWFMKGEHPHQPVPPPPVEGRIEVTDFFQLKRTILPKFQKYCPPSLLYKGSFESSFRPRDHQFLFQNGSTCDFVSHEMPVKALGGPTYDIVWMDEEPPFEHYQENLFRTVDRDGRLVLTFTAVEGITWSFDEIVEKAERDPDRLFYRSMSIYENRFLSPAAIAAVEASCTDAIDRAIRLYGRVVSRSGCVFRNFDPAVHTFRRPHPDWEWEQGLPVNGVEFVGIDPGWDHPTGIVWCVKDVERDLLFVLSERKVAHCLPIDHVEAIWKENDRLGFTDPIYVMDSQANARDATGATLRESYRDAGLSAISGTKRLFEGNQYLELLMKVSPSGKTQLYLHEDCYQLAQEFRRYQVKRVDGKEQYVDKHNDLIAALRYAAWEAKRYRPYEAFAAPEEARRRVSPRTGY